MGDRAVVVFRSSREVHDVAVYLHWDGHRVEELIRGAAARMRAGDVVYAAARFTGHCHQEIEGALSLGVYGLSPDQVGHIESGEAGRLGHGDAGVWVVNVSTGELVHHDTLWNSPEALQVCPPAPPDVRAPRLELFNG